MRYIITKLPIYILCSIYSQKYDMAVWFSIHTIHLQYRWRTHCIHTVWTTNEDAEGKSLEEGFVEQFVNRDGNSFLDYTQKYSRLRCLLRVKGLVIGFYLGWSGHTLLIRKI